MEIIIGESSEVENKVKFILAIFIILFLIFGLDDAIRKFINELA